MKRNVILNFVVFIIPIFFNSCFETCRENRKNEHLNESFNGNIDSLYTDKNDRGQSYVIVKNKAFIIINNIFEKFSKGDTLFKNAGSMKYYWIKNGDTVVFYQVCGDKKIDEVRD